MDHVGTYIGVDVSRNAVQKAQLVAAEIFRVLRPGGVLLATVPNVAYRRGRAELALLGRFDPYGDDRSVVQPWRDPHIRFFTIGSLRRILQMTGDSPITISGHGGMLLSDIPLSAAHCTGSDSSVAVRAASTHTWRAPGRSCSPSASTWRGPSPN